MSSPDYKLTGREVDPVSDLLKAVVAVNWHVAHAMELGWAVTLVVMEDSEALGVTVSRKDGWPTESGEAESSQ